MRTIKDAKVNCARVLVRLDLDLPTKNGRITDPSRLEAAIPTIKLLIKKKAKIILVGHVGRPNGKKNAALSTKLAAKKLSNLLKKPILHLTQSVGDTAQLASKNLKAGQILMLENLRFHKEETTDSKSFAKKLSKLADIYVNESFATAHRKNASVHAITEYLPSHIGLHFASELKEIEKITKKPKPPYVAVLGGVKVSTKLKLINTLAKKASAILIGGAMANTFFAALNHNIGQSKYEKDQVGNAKKLLKKYPYKIILPLDVVTNKKTRNINEVTNSEKILDIGPKTAEFYRAILQDAKTIFWNGPLGAFETKPYDKGTKIIAKAIATSKAKSLIGGGDTLNSISKLQKQKYTHVSVGGGATLALISAQELPALDKIYKKRKYIQ